MSEVDRNPKYCPECRDEFRPEISSCPDCECLLVDALPADPNRPEPDVPFDLVCVFRCSNTTLLPVAESLLMDQGIEYLKKNDLLQNLFGGGQIAVGHNPVTGPAEIWVRDKDAAVAFELLSELGEYSGTLVS